MSVWYFSKVIPELFFNICPKYGSLPYFSQVWFLNIFEMLMECSSIWFRNFPEILIHLVALYASNYSVLPNALEVFKLSKH